MTVAKPWIHICGGETFEVGSQPPSGYIEWHDWARVQDKAGLKQVTCGVCSRWRFPQELSGEIIVTYPLDGRTFKPIRDESPVCRDCAQRRAPAPRRAKTGKGKR